MSVPDGHCVECGLVSQLGWALKCRECWDRIEDEIEELRHRATTAAAAAALDALDASDPEITHSAADAILLGAVPAEVAQAYERLRARTAWWASA